MPAGDPDKRRPPKALVWGWLAGGLTLAVAGAIVGYRATGTFLGAAAGWCAIAIIAGVAQFGLVVVGAIRGLRAPSD